VIFGVDSKENRNFFVSDIPESCKRVTGFRIDGDHLVAAFDKSSAVLWNLRYNQQLRFVDFGHLCRRISVGSSGLDLLAFYRKGYSRKMTRFMLKNEGYELQADF
jgi:hypothetical protein